MAKTLSLSRVKINKILTVKYWIRITPLRKHYKVDTNSEFHENQTKTEKKHYAYPCFPITQPAALKELKMNYKPTTDLNH